MLKVYGKNVLISKINPETKYSSLIIIPDNYVKLSNQGIVKQVGQDVKYIQRGDYVIFHEQFGEDLNDKHGSYSLINEAHVKAKIVQEVEEVAGLYHCEYGTEFATANYTEFFPATTESTIQCLVEHYTSSAKKVEVTKVHHEDPIEETDDDIS